MAPLGEALAGFLRGANLDGRMRERAVFAAWRAAVGPALAERAAAVRFSLGEPVGAGAPAVDLPHLMWAPGGVEKSRGGYPPRRSQAAR